jgi:hypothetical protein
MPTDRGSDGGGRSRPGGLDEPAQQVGNGEQQGTEHEAGRRDAGVS